MKRQHLFTILLTSFFIVIAFHGGNVYAQKTISGDEVCGAFDASMNGGKGGVKNPCGVDDLAKIFKGIFSTIIAIGLPLLVVFIMYRFVVAWYQLEQGNANAYKEAIHKVSQAILGFIIIVALFGGILLVMLKYLGVKDFPLKLLKEFSTEMIIPHAYAATSDRISSGQCGRYPTGTFCTTEVTKYGFVVKDAKGEDGFCFTDNCIPIKSKVDPVSPNDCWKAGADGVYCSSSRDSVCYTGVNNGTCVKLKEVLVPDVTKEQPPAPAPAPKPEAPPTPPAPVTPPSTSCGVVGLPNPLGVCSLYDFILSALNLVMKFFIYPALIAMWVWSGFNYVLAQGAPDKLMKTHKLLMWAVISTFVVFVTQAFLIAVRGSVEKIVPSSSMVIPVSSIVLNNDKVDTNSND